MLNAPEKKGEDTPPTCATPPLNPLANNLPAIGKEIARFNVTVDSTAPNNFPLMLALHVSLIIAVKAGITIAAPNPTSRKLQPKWWLCVAAPS
tara:strand:+ start:615 stop:893 length:279 start_codon:yes stop_codon:yes gene_type:complete